MSSGPQHYIAAEFHLKAAQDAEGGSDAERYNLAAAQVHATLAQTAAIIDQTHDMVGADARNADEWTEAVASDPV